MHFCSYASLSCLLYCSVVSLLPLLLILLKLYLFHFSNHCSIVSYLSSCPTVWRERTRRRQNDKERGRRKGCETERVRDGAMVSGRVKKFTDEWGKRWERWRRGWSREWNREKVVNWLERERMDEQKSWRENLARCSNELWATLVNGFRVEVQVLVLKRLCTVSDTSSLIFNVTLIL